MADVHDSSYQEITESVVWQPALKEAGVAFLLATVLLALFYGFAFRWIHPEFVPFMDRDARPYVAPGNELVPISVGRYRADRDTAVIESFNNDEAILALPRAFEAEDYPFIKVNLEGYTRYSRVKILWRLADDLSTTYALIVNRNGDRATQIAMVEDNENYRGRVADIALLIYDGPALAFEKNNWEHISVASVEFRPFSYWRILEQIFVDWTYSQVWNGSAHNIVEGSNPQALVTPNITLSTLAITGFTLLSLLKSVRCKTNRRNSATLLARSTLILIAFCWMANEALRWTWRVEQVIDTSARYASRHINQRSQGSAVLCSRFGPRCTDISVNHAKPD